MRIIAGIFKGRPLEAPDSQATHPMGDREKLALFNVLGPFSGQENVLDLFAGSGALGLESLSRGARRAVFVDSSAKAYAKIRTNVRNLGLEDAEIRTNVRNLHPLDLADPKIPAGLSLPRAEIRKSSVETYVKAYARDLLSYPPSVSPFDLIFVDPPYDRFDPEEFKFAEDLLSPGGRLVLSHPADFDPTSVFDDLNLLSTKKYAACHLSFYQKRA